MRPTPINKELIDNTIREHGIQDFAKATIREVKGVAAMPRRRVVSSSSRWRWAFPVFPPPR